VEDIHEGKVIHVFNEAWLNASDFRVLNHQHSGESAGFFDQILDEPEKIVIKGEVI